MNDQVEKIAANAWFTVVGRSAMILMIPVLGFVATNLVSMNTRLEVLRVVVETQLADRYRSTDAIRDFRLMQIQIDEVRRRLDLLERAGLKQP